MSSIQYFVTLEFTNLPTVDMLLGTLWITIISVSVCLLLQELAPSPLQTGRLLVQLTIRFV